MGPRAGGMLMENRAWCHASGGVGGGVILISSVRRPVEPAWPSETASKEDAVGTVALETPAAEEEAAPM